MSPEALTSWVDALRTAGPWGLVVVVGYALYVRDKQLRALYERVIDLSEHQIESQTEFKNVLQLLLNTKVGLGSLPPGGSHP